MWLNDILLRGMILAQSATPDAAGELPIKTEILNEQVGLTGIQWAMLILYAIVCCALIACVTSQTSKSEGLMQAMMGGSAPTYKGKKTADDNLAHITNWAAFFFIGLSILMCLVFR